MNKRTKLKAAALALVGTSISPSSYAQFGFCSEPSPPYCINSTFTFDDDLSFSSCRRQLQTYIRQVDDYADCLIREAEQEISEKREEASDAIDKFNCYARGERFCY